MKNGHSKLLGWKKFEESKLFQPILWDTFLNKKSWFAHTGLELFWCTYYFMVKCDICYLVIVWSTCMQYRISNPLFCLGALYFEVKANNISVVFSCPPHFRSLQFTQPTVLYWGGPVQPGSSPHDPQANGWWQRWWYWSRWKWWGRSKKKLYLCIYEVFFSLLFCTAALYLSALE